MQHVDIWAGIFQGSALIYAMAMVMCWPRPPAPRDELLAAAGFCSVAGGLGGRLVWACVAMCRGEPDVFEGLVSSPLSGGFSSFGALGGALLVGVFISRRWRASLGELADFFAPIALSSLAIARMGCAVHGCDFGRQVDARWSFFAARYHAHDAPAWRWFAAQGDLLADGGSPWLAPMPALLSGATWIGVIALYILSRVTRTWPAGLFAARLVMMYGIVRLCGELLRHPGAGAHVLGINVNIVLAACVGIVGAIMARRCQDARSS